jgi:hypothetical protein
MQITKELIEKLKSVATKYQETSSRQGKDRVANFIKALNDIINDDFKKIPIPSLNPTTAAGSIVTENNSNVRAISEEFNPLSKTIVLNFCSLIKALLDSSSSDLKKIVCNVIADNLTAEEKKPYLQKISPDPVWDEQNQIFTKKEVTSIELVRAFIEHNLPSGAQSMAIDYKKVMEPPGSLSKAISAVSNFFLKPKDTLATQQPAANTNQEATQKPEGPGH